MASFANFIFILLPFLLFIRSDLVSLYCLSFMKYSTSIILLLLRHSLELPSSSQFLGLTPLPPYFSHKGYVICHKIIASIDVVIFPAITSSSSAHELNFICSFICVISSTDRPTNSQPTNRINKHLAFNAPFGRSQLDWIGIVISESPALQSVLASFALQEYHRIWIHPFGGSYNIIIESVFSMDCLHCH